MKPTKAEVAAQFDRMSHAYAASTSHAGGDDLAILLQFLAPHAAMRVLDVATGAGHTAVAVAPHVAQVVAVDIAPAMLQRTRELAESRHVSNVVTELADVEALPFPDACFDAVTCRIAPHHFTDLPRAISEIARVLVDGGAFVVEDSVVPDDPVLDRFLNDVERIRDATHVRSLTEPQWRTVLADAGLTPSAAARVRKEHDIADWIARAGLDGDGAQAVYTALATAPAAAIDEFRITFAGRRAARFADEKLILRAEKRARPRA